MHCCKLLTPLLIKAASDPVRLEPRVVSISSVEHKFPAPISIEFETLKTKSESMSTIVRYGPSKLANLLFPQEIARRYPQFTAMSVHPGTVKTDLFGASESGLFVKALQKLLPPTFGVTVEEEVKN